MVFVVALTYVKHYVRNAEAARINLDVAHTFAHVVEFAVGEP